MLQVNTLTQTLSNHFSMHPSRLKTFAATILGAMQSGNCQHYSLSRPLDSPTTLSAVRRTERFFQKQPLSCVDSASYSVEVLTFKGQFDLCLDRTNWEFGSKKINYLVLSWRISKHLSMPLFFVELDKAGNSSTTERVDLVQKFINVFGVERIKSLKADREFIGEAWFSHLLQHKIPFHIRVRRNINVPYGHDVSKAIGDFFDHLNVGEMRTLYKEIGGHPVLFVGKRISKDELLIVMTNKIKQKPFEVLTEYRKRWSIEELFRKLKTSGFNWENTHMKDSRRLEKLLIILSIALLLTYLMGMEIKRPFKKTLNCFAKTIFRYGLQNFQKKISISLNETIAYLTDLLKMANQFVFLESDG
jgi:hypothetical protein